MLVTARLAGRGQDQWNPGLRALGELEPRRGDADDLVRLPFRMTLRPSIGCRRSAAPEGVAQDHATVLPWRASLRHERAAGRGHHPEGLEEAGGDRAASTCSAPASARRFTPTRPWRSSRRGRPRPAPASREGWRARRSRGRSRRSRGRLRDADEARGVGEVERPQDQRVQEVEDDPLAASPIASVPTISRLRPRILRHRAQRETQVAGEVGTSGPPSGRGLDGGNARPAGRVPRSCPDLDISASAGSASPNTSRTPCLARRARTSRRIRPRSRSGGSRARASRPGCSRWRR